VGEAGEVAREDEGGGAEEEAEGGDSSWSVLAEGYPHIARRLA
jgi:hypothetical protein